MDLNEKLIFIFQNVNEWLKFAEAKNGVLLAFSASGQASIIGFLSSSNGLPSSIKYGAYTSLALLCTATFICSISFLPKTDRVLILFINKKSKQKKSISHTDNLLYYGDLKNYQPDELIYSIQKNYLQKEVDFSKESYDLADQIIVNSRITYEKYLYFRISLLIMIFSILVNPVILIIYLILFKHL